MVYVFNFAVSFIKFFMLMLLCLRGPLVSGPFLLNGRKDFTFISFISAFQILGTFLSTVL